MYSIIVVAAVIIIIIIIIILLCPISRQVSLVTWTDWVLTNGQTGSPPPSQKPGPSVGTGGETRLSILTACVTLAGKL